MIFCHRAISQLMVLEKDESVWNEEEVLFTPDDSDSSCPGNCFTSRSGQF